MVEIYLHVDDSYISFLSIPLGDVQRLSVRPLKWIRFVMFSICGSQGELFATPDGRRVNYDAMELTDTKYYYKPDHNCIYIDSEVLNPRITSAASTQRSTDFRNEVMRRDGDCCIITQEVADNCDAAHLIAKCKGDEYIEKIIADRRALYDASSLPSTCGIDAIDNGVLLSKVVHSDLGRGAVAFIKTPNFALETDDIPRDLSKISSPSPRITLHRLMASSNFDPDKAERHCNLERSLGQDPDPGFCYSHGLQVDAMFRGTGGSQPPAIILDFMYGVASYALWKSGDIHALLKKYHADHFKSIAIPSRVPSDNDESSDNTGDPGSSGQSKKKEGGARAGHKMAGEMDEMNLILMLLHGITPEEAARRQEKRMEEEEERFQEAGREKVTEWLQTGIVT